MAQFEVEAGENIEGVDPDLIALLREAASYYPGAKVIVTDGLASRSSTPNHPRGRAVDVKLVDANGRELPNLRNASTFREYEQFAQTARAIQQAKYPDLNDKFAWGGYFRQGVAFDQMHFDIGGNRGAYGGWDTGLNASGRARLSGAESRPYNASATWYAPQQGGTPAATATRAMSMGIVPQPVGPQPVRIQAGTSGGAANRNAMAAARAAAPVQSLGMPAKPTKTVGMGLAAPAGQTAKSLFAGAINPPQAVAAPGQREPFRPIGGLFAGLFGLGQQQPQAKSAMGITSPGLSLSRGSPHTAKVQNIQTKLNSLGYNSGPVDGDFGPVTERAVRTFQRDKGLEEDGVVGPKTSYALDKRDRLGEGGGSESKSFHRSEEKSGGGFWADFRDSFKR
jgi:hypothetical protein